MSRLLGALTPDSGMAFVYVQHLSPSHTSLLAEILGRGTAMPVRDIADGMPIAPNQVFVVPPGALVSVDKQAFRLEPAEHASRDHPVDHFLAALAAVHAHRSIAVILSGSGSDGAYGCREVKAAGGITFAQDASAEHDNMPRSAEATGAVDFVLAPEAIAEQLHRIAQHPLVALPDEAAAAEPLGEQAFGDLLERIREATGVDFSQYKRTTLRRRVARRMVLHRLVEIDDYLRLLEDAPGEAEALYHDLLITVTEFFRNPEVFETLKRHVFPALIADRPRHSPIRIWILGCATGEEAYSLAIAFTEFLEEADRPVALQVFATDLSARAIDIARAGTYPRTIANQVAPERLRRFFVEVDGSYRVTKRIRDLVVFARHNALVDPPFSHIDLVTCRNLLIYLEPAAQHRLIALLHYALRPTGFLLLGTSETVGSQRELFQVIDPKQKLFVRKPGSARVPLATPPMRPALEIVPRPLRHLPARGEGAPPGDPLKEADRLLLSRYAPAGVVVNSDFDILQFRGDTGAYLAPAPGRASLNLLKMLREGLLVAVRGAVQKALREETTVREDNLVVKSNGSTRRVHVEVIPIRAATVHETCLLVLFEDADQVTTLRPAPGTDASLAPGTEASPAPGAPEVLEELTRVKQELSATREYLQSVIEQQEAANEELQSANEEVQSANEELQSINEELETSKEEVQSTNEELATVNDELIDRNRELTQLNNDLLNLLGSVQMAIVMLGPDLRIRRFTPAAEKLLNLIASDVGRPISNLKLNVDVPDLEKIVTEVIDSVTPVQREAQDRDGHWYLLRIRPYRTMDNRIDGAVLILVDVDALKKAEDSLRASEERFRLLADSAPVLIWVSTAEGLEFVNRAFREYVGADEAALRGMGWLGFVHDSDRERLTQVIRHGVARQAGFTTIFRMRRADGDYRWIKATAARRLEPDGTFVGHTGSLIDVTDLKDAEYELREADRRKDRFLAMLSHELRAPLAPLRNAVQLLREHAVDPQQMEWTWGVMDRQVETITRMIDDLLDVSRVTQGKVQLRREVFDLRSAIGAAVEAVRPQFDERRQHLDVTLSPSPLIVDGDPVRLEQVFSNLLANASKFTHEGGHIRLTARMTPRAEHDARVIEVRVRDDGTGIAPSALPYIFEPFFQADQSLDRARGGLGIGLSLVRSLIEQHGGSVEAYSDGNERGTEFVVRLPGRADDTPQDDHEPGTVQDAETDAEPESMRRRILLVEDQVDAGETLALLLRAVGHDVSLVHSGAGAVPAAEQFQPDVVLLDIGLPDVDGFEVARRLRAHFPDESLIVAAVSGYGQQELRQRAREAGFDEYFTKPVSIEALRGFLANAVPSRM